MLIIALFKDLEEAPFIKGLGLQNEPRIDLLIACIAQLQSTEGQWITMEL